MGKAECRIRRQLTLFVPSPFREQIEAVRRIVDPIQSSLISAHVTLCREDELSDLESITRRLKQSPPAPIVLRFGPPRVFMGHGLLLECTEGLNAFRTLREYILGSTSIRDHQPHITLAHPRNPQAPGNSLNATAGLNDLTISFDEIALIEQRKQHPWIVLHRFALRT